MAKRNCVLIAHEHRGEEIRAIFWNRVECRHEWLVMNRANGTVLETIDKPLD